MHSRPRKTRPDGLQLAGLSCLLCLLSVPAAGLLFSEPELTSDWRWMESVTMRGESPRALAQQAGRRRFAVGDDAGVSVLRGERRDRAALGAVRDLVFDRDGTLWIATDAGLYRWAESERPVRRALRGGERANHIHRLVATRSGLLVGNQAGAFWSSSGGAFQALSVGGASFPASLVALAPDGAGSSDSESGRAGLTRAWVLSGERLFAIRGFVSSSGLRVVSTRPLTMPRPSADRQPVDLVVDPHGARMVLVFEDLIAWRSIEHSDSDSDGSAWRIERPVLPPGAVIRRLGWAAGRLWIATDHGLLEGQQLADAFVRSGSPVGTSECVDVQSGAESTVVALCRRGIFVRGPEVSARVDRARGGDSRLRSSGVASGLESDLPLAAIRRRAIDRAGLAVERSHRLRDGMHRRAYWPELSLRFDADFDRDREWEADQSFIGGEMRRLFDRSDDQSQGFGVSIGLEWDLGGIAFPDDAIDLSRELRLVMSLRDDVSDEINQLYFERQGIREQLKQPNGLAPQELTKLRLRASELEAGLDAWTGGWLTRWRSDRELKGATLEPTSKPTSKPASRPPGPALSDPTFGPDKPVERSTQW